ncbi:hypothetical protein, partial [Wolbachia endosymbiont of Drosophila incompta]
MLDESSFAEYDKFVK